MKLWDTHVHSDLSMDSREPMELYVKKAAEAGEEYFITTEHLDLESHLFDGDDIAPDFERQKEIIHRLNQKYPIKVLWGIEIGWRKDIHRRNAEISRKYPFDMIILSVHETDYSDVSFPGYKNGRTTDECYDEYLGLIINAITEFDNFDTLAHIDYVLRYVGDTDLSRHSEKLTQIFRLLISKGKGLEINTKIFPRQESVRRREEIVKMYTSAGGTKFTIGSDRHSVKAYKNGFETVKQILIKYGIDSVYTFINRKEQKISLETL